MGFAVRGTRLNGFTEFGFVGLSNWAIVLGVVRPAPVLLAGLTWPALVPRVLHDGARGQEGECWPHCGRKRLY